MKDSLNRVDQICSEAGALGIDVSQEQADLLSLHLDLVIEKNKSLNLTRIVDPQDAVTLHVVDSLSLLPYLPVGTKRIFDIGTGAGFPGIPLVIVRGCHATLDDSVKKKAKAVEEFVEHLNLSGSIDVIDQRVEDFSRTHKGGYDAVVGRAVAPLPTLVEYAAPLLAKDGVFIASKGNPSEDECTAGIAAAKLCGLDLITKDEVFLPRDMGHRCIFVYQKKHKAHVILPRQTGKAKNAPLA